MSFLLFFLFFPYVSIRNQNNSIHLRNKKKRKKKFSIFHLVNIFMINIMIMGRKKRIEHSCCSFASLVQYGKKKRIQIYIYIYIYLKNRARSSVCMPNLSINMFMTRNRFKLKTEIHYNLLLSFSENFFVHTKIL